jgi:hypothetical protein
MLTWRARAGLLSLIVIAAVVCLAACNRQSSGGGIGGMLGLASPGTLSGAVGYVNMDAVIAAHPLHGQLQAMQDQITVLQQLSQLEPAGMSPQQTAAYEQMQRDLNASEQQFEGELAQRRSYYLRRESDALSSLQASTLGQSANSGGVLGGLQQQFGVQAQAIQKQAMNTLNSYRTELFRQDNDHLKQVQQTIAAGVREQLRQRESTLSSNETKYQIDLVKADQQQRLNLQAKLQNLALTDKQRADYNAQLSAIDAREQARINVMKSQDDAQIATYQKQLQAQAAAKYDAERTATQQATQAKLVARQKDVQTALAPQMRTLSGQFQQQLNSANQRLAGNQKYRQAAQSVHDQMQAGYIADATRAENSYQQIRTSLVSKYSAIAHMQFQDNEAIAAQADKLAADRRDLYEKIQAQVAVQVAQIALKDGIGTVFQGLRAPGNAIDLTSQVTKAVTTMQGATMAPTSPSTGGT